MRAHALVFRKGLIWSAVSIAVIGVAGAVVGWFVAGSAGLWSAVGGFAAAAVFGLGTQAVAYLTVRRHPVVWVAAVGASTMVKILLVMVAAVVAQNIEGLVKPMFGAVLVLGAVSAVVVDVVVFARGRIPYVEPRTMTSDDGVG
ncbi:hypothetical protein [Demequina capsici]|uniref:ATP synthase protein I n=1 Tax=Demequina capsici TaxID=3075620 RepID=A0AA96F887_9MICO|nr:hypothetical protein [Demequina sp. OYTSA14]WNM23801.1 hypothetical protein RN606_10575 [Demequina sp. OYTSA14]